ncbi:MAG: hypothetical protein ABSF96_13345 [Steroidobacteraceae bacterium]|jgi:hypothetical protein
MIRRRAMPQALFALLGAISVVPLHGQAAESAASVPDARSQAPLDFTGYWISLVTEDWRFRMLVADPGDTESVPLNPEGIKAAAAWNPQQARAASDEACRAFGAGGIMRIPGRVHITWQDANTLKIETDSGTQTRLLHFGGHAATNEAPTWQGYSVARWQGLTPQRRGVDLTKKEGYLQVTTTALRPGYLRTNGVPYGADTQLLEYFDSFKEANGDEYLVVTTVVNDTQYLTQPFVTSSHFRKLPDATGWDPTPCRAGEPR